MFCVSAIAPASADFQSAERAYKHHNFGAALRELKPLAEEGHPGAQTLLAVMYGNGDGVQQDFNEALKWLRKAAAQNHADAVNLIGLMYTRGLGVRRDHKEALAWFQKAAKQGHDTAHYNIGLMYKQGFGVKKDLAKTTQWWKRAAELGSDDARTKLYALFVAEGQRLLKRHGYNPGPIDGVMGTRTIEAIRQFQKDNDLPVTGRLYKDTRTKLKTAVELDPLQSFEGIVDDYHAGIIAPAQRELQLLASDLERLAKTGSEETRERLAEGYYKIGLMATDPIGQEWLHKATELGHHKARRTLRDRYYELATRHSQGDGVAVNENEAAQWLRKAAEHGHAAAQYELGNLYKEGGGVDEDFGEAVSWWTAAAEGGNRDAQYALALAYYEGKVVPKDIQLAAKWFRKAASRGHSTAKDTLILLFKQGQTHADSVTICHDGLCVLTGDMTFSTGFAPATRPSGPINVTIWETLTSAEEARNIQPQKVYLTGGDGALEIVPNLNAARVLREARGPR